MKTYFISLVNALVLITFGLWGFFGSETMSFTALIPVAVGIILVIVNPGLRKDKKLERNIAALLTFLVLLGLIKPLLGALERGDSLAISRVAVMMFFTLIALFYFIRQFILSRKKK